MLVLSRRPQERVKITCPDGTEIWVLPLRGTDHGRIQLGFDAPREVVIQREEIIK